MSCVASADTAANCTYEDIKGVWLFELGSGNNDKTINCSKPFEARNALTVKLTYPDIATDQFNNIGYWTLIYNQGFEIQIAGRKYFGFSYYEGSKSFCHQVLGGWSHDMLGHDWACFNSRKSEVVIKHNTILSQHFDFRVEPEDMVASINKKQSSWRAKHYNQFDNYSQEDLIRMAGGRKSQIFNRPKPIPLTAEHKLIRQSLPDSYDWRNVSGVNYVSPVRNQENCGSCYAFASMAMAEARVKIQTNNTQSPVFSTQDVVECSYYSQGCEGGFPYLVAGKYAEDYGLVLEKCNPYKGMDGTCHTDPGCERHYFTNYAYIGGYYGGCNEVLMQQAIYLRGPIAVSFEVYHDFLLYHSGVYHHTAQRQGLDRFNPFVITNHVVLVVGWGQLSVDQGGTKYWIVKNSWGTNWGLNGYFWIQRGNDECGIESIAVESRPIFKYMQEGGR
ncbi:dipeptidyl peptidase 1 [Plakobranchus ocellatus]|uniref:Dipeptidyl peptidase 1 n=1 Tax=Plakobranchus ocellatus TaxID=259542 RepID=A0AAV4DFN9_9GAST|nr:dipeptidyl peptidase 1 [Plakobranchus ocellatus]